MSKNFNDQNFQSEVIEVSKTKPVLVDFFANWCMPCRMQAPIIDEVSELMKDKASVGKLDTEEAQETATKYNVMSIPTLMIFRNGELKETMMGMQPKESLIEILKKYI